MEKKEMGFIEKFKAAGDELEKEIKDGGAMIIIASEKFDVKTSLCYFSGDKTMSTILLAGCALKDKDFKRMLERALKVATLKEKENK